MYVLRNSVSTLFPKKKTRVRINNLDFLRINLETQVHRMCRGVYHYSVNRNCLEHLL